MKKIFTFIILILLCYTYSYASYYVVDVDKKCILNNYDNLEKLVKKCGVNSHIANDEVFLNGKFIGKNPTPLFIAVVHNDFDMVKKLVSKDADVNVINYFPESSPLMKAVENNNMKIAKYLLDNGANVNLTTPKYYLSAIDFASNYDMASLLLSHNAKVDKINGYTYYTPLQNAILLKNVQMVKAYLPKSNINQKDYLFKKDALYFAISTRNMEIINLLVSAGATVSPEEYSIYTEMISNREILDILSNIINSGKKEMELRNDIQEAILYEKVKSTDLLIYHKFPFLKDEINDSFFALVDPTSNSVIIPEYEPYRYTIKNLNFPKYEEETGYKLDDDSDDYGFDSGDVALRYEPIAAALEYNDMELFQMMLDANHLKMQYPVKYHTNLFAIAIFTDNIEAVKLLMKYNYPPIPCAPPIYNNTEGLYSTSTIAYSCKDLLNDVLSNYNSSDMSDQEYGYYKKLQDMFLKYDINGYNDFLNSFIRDDLSFDLDENELLEMVASKPAGFINHTNDAGQGLLHIALEKEYNRLATYLIINGFDIYDNYYFVPIEWTKNNKFIEQLLIMKENMYLGQTVGAAVFNNAGDAEKMKLFIKYGFDVNVRNEKGKPILFRAIETKNLESVKLLVEKGANLDDLYEGIDVLDYAQNYGSEEIASYIQSKLN